MAIERCQLWLELAYLGRVEPVKRHAMSFAQAVLHSRRRELRLGLIEIQATMAPHEVAAAAFLDQRPPGIVRPAEQGGQHAGNAFHLGGAA